LPLQSRLLREPLPSPWARLADVEVIVLAFETSGADLGRDHILAAGWVLVRGGRIVLASARELRVRDDGQEEPGDDGITSTSSDRDLEDAESTEAVVRYLLSELAGRAIAAHDAAIEQAFLDAELRRIGGVPMPNPFVSTKAVERRIAADWGIQLREQDGELLLDSCRARHGLPERSRRSAGADAVACAELLLAQIGRMGGPDRVKLRQLM
jgi:DNA polymerase III subunit epsilon